VPTFKSQLGQDKWVLEMTNNKTGGYFVEFGATDGVYLSNTFALEKFYNWSGILAEPAKAYHNSLINNRTCNIDFSCVYSESNAEVNFMETEMDGLSTIASMNPDDWAYYARLNNATYYPVTTISLEDLLVKYDAPRYIDYLSIDTEGSEFEILNSFDFSKYYIKYITVEHNYTNIRKDIEKLLVDKGFVKSNRDTEYDDWYVNNTEWID
jgi:FkbM family methyltransferase